MKKYVSHKTVEAFKIVNILRHPLPGGALLSGADGELVTVSDSYCRQRLKEGEGYYVLYNDGFESWSPVEAFEKGYTPLNDLPD